MYRIGVDVGGTFTDCVCERDDGSRVKAKVATTAHDPSVGVLDGVEELARILRMSASDLLANTERFVHGTTVGTNALLENTGARTAILTSRGHEDTFIIGKIIQKRLGNTEREMARMAALDLADPPLVPRELVWGVSERVDYKGEEICPLSESDVIAAAQEMVAAGVEAVAVCFLWSFAAPDHERRAAELIREHADALFVITSHEIAPVLGEYERMVTTVLGARLGRPIAEYLTQLEARLAAGGYRFPLLMMQSSGGLTPAGEIRRNAVSLIDSGPVGGVLGARFLGQRTGVDNVICTDVGGTSFDVGLISQGEVIIESAPIVGKYQFRSPKVQVASIGSGGGSVAWVDETGVLKVGPRSAGAVPGPACYGRGGVEPTVTDADVVLGYLDPTNFLGGNMRLDRHASELALGGIAARLEMSVIEVAEGVRRVLDSQMADLVRRVTIERGYDPRDFVLYAYGGMGSAHCARYAADLGVKEVFIPSTATAFSAEGMLTAPILHTYEASVSRRSPFTSADPHVLTEAFADLERRAVAQFEVEGIGLDQIQLRRVLLTRFQMQVHEIEVEVDRERPLDLDHLDDICARFVEIYRARYGKNSAFVDAGFELVTCRIEGRAQAPEARALEPPLVGDGLSLVPRGSRAAYFFEAGGFVETAIYHEDDLESGRRITGPAIIERAGDTVVVPPGAALVIDGEYNLRLSVAESPVRDTSGELDPITFEVLRNRLWAINDEQAMTAAKIAGTPIVYEALDFNSGILDAEGYGVLAGVYVTYHTTGLDISVDAVKSSFGARGEIFEGDIFLTNDPWKGAIHPSDFVCISPVHVEGRIVAWTAIVMHDPDVGGPVAGSFAVGATEVFGECPIYPPLKLVERGNYKQEIEDLFLRNSRTPALNALNMRARVACQAVARDRILGLIAEYGLDAFTEVCRRIQGEVRTIVGRKLAEIPDGTWREHSYVDHDGNDNILYEAHLAVTKVGSKITFDFTGTSKQAPGMINCTVSGLRGGVMAAFLPLVCYDVPWATGGLRDIVEIVAEEGTLNNASFPAGVSGGSVFGEAVTENLATACIAKMLACSDKYRRDLTGVWYPFFNGYVISGLNQYGGTLAAVLLDASAGGAGARSHKDGVDCGGYIEAVSVVLPNVESNERVYPILELYRKRRDDTCGHGKFRGGVGMEMLVVAHDNPVPLTEVIFASSVSQPEAPGIYGALPASVQGNLLLRDTDVRALLAAGLVPRDRSEFAAAHTEHLASKDVSQLDGADAHLMWVSGGGGYGDPLHRDPDAVARDVRRGLCSQDTSVRVYGVVLDAAGDVDVEATETERKRCRETRLSDGVPAAVLIARVGITGRAADE